MGLAPRRMDRQREVSRALATGRGPLRILYIIRIPPPDATVQPSFDFLPACHRASARIGRGAGAAPQLPHVPTENTRSQAPSSAAPPAHRSPVGRLFGPWARHHTAACLNARRGARVARLRGLLTGLRRGANRRAIEGLGSSGPMTFGRELNRPHLG